MSLIVELLAYEDSVSDDKAVEHFFSDLAVFNEASSSTICHNEIIKDPKFVPNIPSKFAKCVLIGYQTVVKFQKRDSRVQEQSASDANTNKNRNNVQIVMLLLRLPDVGTDVLITLNSPSKTVSIINDVSSINFDYKFITLFYF